MTAKAFAAGVILATGFVHMLASGTEAFNNPFLPEFPCSKFPFPGFFAMVAALITLLVDFMGTQYYERKQEKEATDQSDEQLGVNSLQGVLLFLLLRKEGVMIKCLEKKQWRDSHCWHSCSCCSGYS